MTTFSPEFSEFWLPQTAGSRDRDVSAAVKKGAEPTFQQAAEPTSQEDALEALAGRINAARSVI